MEPVGDPDDQDFGIKDEDKRQNCRSDVVGETLDAGTDRITAGYAGCSKRRQADRRRVVGKDAEVENKKMHRNQRYDQTGFGPQADDNRRHQG